VGVGYPGWIVGRDVSGVGWRGGGGDCMGDDGVCVCVWLELPSVVVCVLAHVAHHLLCTPHPFQISESADALIKQLFELNESGPTALGPAVVVATAMASTSTGSKVRGASCERERGGGGGGRGSSCPQFARVLHARPVMLSRR
jgi:hypothetical protein